MNKYKQKGEEGGVSTFDCFVFVCFFKEYFISHHNSAFIC